MQRKFRCPDDLWDAFCKKTNEPSETLRILVARYVEGSPLTDIMGVEEAAKLWDLSPGYIKNLCNAGKLEAEKIGNTWVLDKHQQNPKLTNEASHE